MKPKTLSKKLTLNKSTVADLNGDEMIKVKGGAYTTICSMLPDPFTCKATECGPPCP